jgi:putative FmdB family regulatory protein
MVLYAVFPDNEFDRCSCPKLKDWYRVMPTYTYVCKKCEHEMDVFHGMNDAPKVKCAACGSTRTQKRLGTGAGIIFKGSGFYETDYKGGAKKKEESGAGGSEKSEAKSESKETTKSDSKSESKSDSKPATKKAKSD